MLLALALVAAVLLPPTPAQYYARALDTMNALPQPSYATYAMDLKAAGAEITTECFANHEAALAIGWGRGMKHEIQARGEYALSGNAAAIQEKDGSYCPDDTAIFKPQWAAMHDWMRYGISEAPISATKQPPQSGPAHAPGLQTIASVTAVAPAAYDVFDDGAAKCPDGSAGHALHLIARSTPDEHPLTDVIIETATMRFCMMRFNLVNAVIAGTGAKGDATVNFGESNGYWSVTHGHLVFSLRMLGVSLKHFALDTSYSDFRYPQNLPQ